MRALMIDARRGLAETRTAALQSAGIDADLFSFLAEGDEALLHVPYEMALVNRELPDGKGIEWVRSRRRGGLGIPLVVMAPQNEFETRIVALDAGADDAVADTIDPRELAARCRALMRRQPFLRPEIVRAGNLQLDLACRQVHADDKVITLPRRELGILERLMTSFNRTVTRTFLETTIYGSAGDVCPNSIEVRISRLRRALAQSGSNVAIETVRGLGYRLQLKEMAPFLPEKAMLLQRDEAAG